MSDLITLESGDVLDLSAYPLPDGEEDRTFNIELMSVAMGRSTKTIRDWIAIGMPVKQRGGNGQSYELVFSQCYAWRKWRDQSEEAYQKSLKKDAEQKALLFLNEAAPAGGPRMTAKEVREWSEAELIRNKAAMQRGELVRVHLVVDMLEHLLVTVRNSVNSAPDWLEQEFSLNPTQVAKSETYFDGILEEMRHQIVVREIVPADLIALPDHAKMDAAG